MLRTLVLELFSGLRCLRLAAAALLALSLWGCGGSGQAPGASSELQELTSGYEAAADQDNLYLSEEAMLYLSRRVPSHLTGKAKFDALIRLFQRKNGLRLAYQADLTWNPAETFAQGRGNCLSFTQLFVAMARQLGLRARFQEVAAPPTWERNGDLLSAYRHMAVFVRLDGRVYGVDFGGVLRGNDSLVGRIISDQRAKAHYFSNLGAHALIVGDNEEAISHFKRALTLAPDLAFLWSNLGLSLARERQDSAAERALQMALAIDSDESSALNNLSALFARQGREEEIEALSERLRKAGKRNPYYHYGLGEAEFAEGRFDKAIRHYRKAIRRKRDDPLFYFRLAQSQLHGGDLKRALRSYKRTLKFAEDEDQRAYFEEKMAVYLNGVAFQRSGEQSWGWSGETGEALDVNEGLKGLKGHSGLR